MKLVREHTWMEAKPASEASSSIGRLRVETSRLARVTVALVPLWALGSCVSDGLGTTPTPYPVDEQRAFTVKAAPGVGLPVELYSVDWDGASYGVIYEGEPSTPLEIDFTMQIAQGVYQWPAVGAGTRDVSPQGGCSSSGRNGNQGNAWGAVVMAEFLNGCEGDLVTSCEVGRVNFLSQCSQCG